MSRAFQTVRILGIDFFNDSLEKALDSAIQDGGLILAPSGPGLSELGKDPLYDAALRSADINLIDSGYLALLWQKKTGERLQRHSGLKFIKALVEDPRFSKSSGQLWVMPAAEHARAAASYLQEQGLALDSECFYEAPYYADGKVTDEALLEIIRRDRPRHIILAIAGGKQEVLGLWLREQLDDKPAIICIGAAIAFLSGQQANIPPWADRVYLGWLLRILKDPKTFLPRYWKARKLRQLIKKYGGQAPTYSR